MDVDSDELVVKLNAVLGRLDLRHEARDVVNRRRAVRHKVRMPLNLYLTAEGSEGVMMEIFTRNLSSSGIGFVSQRVFQQGEQIVIDFNVKDFPQRLILARVAYGRYCSSGLYEIGAEFLESIETHGTPVIPTHWLARKKTGDRKPAKDPIGPPSPPSPAPVPAHSPSPTDRKTA